MTVYGEYKCCKCGKSFSGVVTFESRERSCDKCFMMKQLKQNPPGTSFDISHASTDVCGLKGKEDSFAKEPLCFRCGKQPEKRLLNGEFWCPQCQRSFGVEETRTYLIERMKEAERRMLQNSCVTCGRQLRDPNWCSWCGSEPEPAESIIEKIKKQVRAIDIIIASGGPVLFKKALSGDKQAVANIFEEALEYETTWKSFIKLGATVVDFLIGELGSDCKAKSEEYKADLGYLGWPNVYDSVNKYKMGVIRALGEIGDVRALEALIEAINRHRDDTVFKALDTIGLPPRAFGPLLIKLRQRYPLGSFPIRLEDTANFWIFNRLSKLIDHAAAEILASDLSAASQMDDVPVDTLKYRDERHHHLHDTDLMIVPETLDCSWLRQAAHRELRRRGLEKV